MDFTELAKKRYSVRKFDHRPVEDEKMQAILEAGNLAPTAKNLQSHRIYVVRSEENLKKVRSLTRCHYGAPVVLVFAYDTDEEWHNPDDPNAHSGPQDASIVATHIMLKAAESGIGSVWVNLFNPAELKRELGLPENEIPLLLMPIGYAAEDSQPGYGHGVAKPLSETVKII